MIKKGSGSITVVNKFTYTPGISDFYIGRGSPLGNPFTHRKLAGTKAIYKCGTREEAIESYKEYIKKEIARPNQALNFELYHIIHCLIEGFDIQLICFCKPKSCHGDIIKEIILHRYKIYTEKNGNRS